MQFEPLTPNSNQQAPWESPRSASSLPSYISKTFLWMFLGLLASFAVAVGCYFSGVALRIAINPTVLIVITLAELVLVVLLSARLHKLSVGAVTVLYFGYAVLNGLVFSCYFYLFELPMLLGVFALTAFFFGALALFGLVTKTDLSSLGRFLFFGLIFLLIVGVISIFLPFGETLDKIYCLIGIAIFLLFTAYDVQKIKRLHAATAGDTALAQKASIFAAFQLYLDFINLFLYLLRFFASKRD